MRISFTARLKAFRRAHRASRLGGRPARLQHPDCRGPLHVSEGRQSARHLEEERERARRQCARRAEAEGADAGENAREGAGRLLRAQLASAAATYNGLNNILLHWAMLS